MNATQNGAGYLSIFWTSRHWETKSYPCFLRKHFRHQIYSEYKRL